MKQHERKNFFDTASKLINTKIQPFCKKDLNKETCTQIYLEVFNTLVEVLTKSHVKLSNETMNLLAQSYYGCIAINESSQGLDPNVFDKLAKIENVPDIHELLIVAMLSEGTQLAVDAVAEIRRRS